MHHLYMVTFLLFNVFLVQLHDCIREKAEETMYEDNLNVSNSRKKYFRWWLIFSKYKSTP